ncbi:substrate-binding domain-containing protein [Hornefia butyriciproducens]|uniref:substrate-binding domain-containing protein n=1 Tax=Hornefia butyriciproducens TaxID=2652293 RepID=UPI002A91C582|nr:substrate-binding domain-containing protein [Hornefia butyriciproducens]MCI7413637.1 extracellular solute-binding protein [Clostridiales bacterium]MDY6210766.1 substrate-binding domain-containing protein [Hornefia butyriciproducens]
MELKRMKKVLAVGVIAAMAATMFTACGSSSSGSSDSDASGKISVISREEGSGTRGAFIELFGIETKDKDGNKTDNTIKAAEITNSTAVMIQTVQGNKAAIGYISLGSLASSVKALKVDGNEASVENVKKGTYKVSRPFNIVIGKKTNAAAKDFINYIMSKEGQKIVEKEGYVPEDTSKTYSKSDASGKISVAGSSSVTPLMEKLAEAYQKVNSDVKVEVQESDSTTGITSATEGVCNIGMASRDLEKEETDKGVKSKEIARDGIAVIVNKDNSLSEITSEQVQKIYTGEITKWDELK